MPRLLHDHRVFWRQFRDNYHTTGAIAPSSRFLGRALVRYVGQQPGEPQRVLEVGPGTGSVTAHLVRQLGPDDRLDLVELNEQFVRRLNERFAHEPAFRKVSNRSRVLHQRLESLPPTGEYDLIVSGLPLNNFAVADVEHILATFRGLLRPGGVLSFFEYVAIRQARALVSGRKERTRLKGIARALDGILGAHEIKRDCVWPNLPPAWVHHVQLSDRSPVKSASG
jgi:phosphatidylethanolamine/phosphatidyl-N-methylethanolamine N-methyltransferase